MRYWIGFLIAAVVASLVLTVASNTDIGAYLLIGAVLLGAITAFLWLTISTLRPARRRF